MGMTGIRVQDDKNVIRIINGENALLVHKAQVRTIDILQGDTVRIDIGEGALHHIYIKWSDVAEPVLASVEALRDAIKNMLFQQINIAGGTGGGDATAANQFEQTALLQEMTSTLNLISSGIAVIVNDTFNNPLRIDESHPNIIYYGYAVAGTLTDAAQWAIKRVTRSADLFIYEWANGAQTFVNIWDRRIDLTYQRLPSP